MLPPPELSPFGPVPVSAEPALIVLISGLRHSFFATGDLLRACGIAASFSRCDLMPRMNVARNRFPRSHRLGHKPLYRHVGEKFGKLARALFQVNLIFFD